MKWRFLRKKRTFAFLFIAVLILLFYNSQWMGRWIYPIKYEAEIRSAAKEERIDPFLLASIIRVESNYTYDKISSKGAVGLMQIMPETADWIAAGSEYAVPIGPKLLEPEVNIDIGAKYVRFLSEQFAALSDDHADSEDRIAVIAAAYNAGPGSVGKWLSDGAWNGDHDETQFIPYGETRHFVQRIIYYYNKYVRYYEDWTSDK